MPANVIFLNRVELFQIHTWIKASKNCHYEHSAQQSSVS
jgi:hypothetical protein